MDTTREEQMQAIIRQWEQSGKTQKEFAQIHQISLSTLRYWLSKSKDKPMAKAGFIALPNLAGLQICLHYPNGVELVLPATAPLALIKELVRMDAACSR